MRLLIALFIFLTIIPFLGYAQSNPLPSQLQPSVWSNPEENASDESMEDLSNAVWDESSLEDWIVDDLIYTEEELDYLEEIKQRRTPRNCEIQNGGASWYGPGFHGRRTANGERFNQNALTAAHKTLKFGSLVRVTYRNRSVVVRINDAGPFVRGRVIDLSKAAAQAIGLISAGHGQVQLELLSCGEG